jgi:hypothetical protein
MKYKIIAILLFSVASYSQGVNIEYGMSKTLTIGASKESNGSTFGINCSFYTGNPDIASFMPIGSMEQFSTTHPNKYFKDYFTTPHNAIFATVGNHSGKLLFAMRIGMQNSCNYTTYGGDSTSSSYSPFYYKEVTPYDLLLGVSFSYNLEDDFALNAGFDNFNKITLGMTVYFGRSHHTNHMCKK